MANTWSIQREPSFELQTGKVLLKRRLNMNALEKSTPLRTSSVRDPARSKGEFTKSTDHQLCPDIGYQLLQIGREAIGNALRYAKAKKVRLAKAKNVRLVLGFAKANIELSIEDDGIGFRPAPPTSPERFGLSTIRQRACRIGAKFTLRTSRGTGTAIRIVVPCPSWSYRL
jgi:signal transduction histidine kinase